MIRFKLSGDLLLHFNISYRPFTSIVIGRELRIPEKVKDAILCLTKFLSKVLAFAWS